MHPQKRFDQYRPFFVLGIVVAVWLFLPLVLKTFTRVSLFEIQAPIIVLDSYISDLQTFWSNRSHSKDQILAAGRNTASLIAQYSFSVQQNEYLRAEIRRLENLLKLSPMPGFRLEAARVAHRDFSGWWQRMVIRKGSNYGVSVGAPVVFSGGVVGRIVEVHRYTAVIDLVTSPTFRIAACVLGSDRPSSYQGGVNKTFQPPHGSVKFVSNDIYASSSRPVRLVTSALGDVFPPGITIGEITALEASTDGLFKTGDVRLDNKIGSLTEVTVLVPFRPLHTIAE